MINRISFLFLLLVSSSISAQEYLKLQGVIANSEGNPVPYAHVYTEDKAYGTLSNRHGQFRLSVPISYCEKYIVASHVGYKPNRLKLSCGLGELEIRLEEENILLNEVTVSALTAKAIVIKAIEALEENYLIDSINYQIFTRVIEEVESEPILIQEYLFDLFSRKDRAIDFHIIKARSKPFGEVGNRMHNTSTVTTIQLIEAELMLKYTEAFLKMKKVKRYDYSFGEDVVYHGNSFYRIMVKSLKDDYTLGGELWIAKDDYGIAYVRSNSKDETWNNGFTKSTTTRTSRTFFKKRDSKWQLSHGYYSFVKTIKNFDKPITYDQVYVVNKISDSKPFSQEEQLGFYIEKSRKYFESFDDEFWEHFNFIPLETKIKELK